MIDRERFLEMLVGMAALPLFGCGSSMAPCEEAEDRGTFELTKSDSEWRELLTLSEFIVLFQQGTEAPFTSPLLAESRAGTYICKACFLPLFSSTTKYETGTGWPSFWEPLEGQLGFLPDCRLSEPRTEYLCRRCGGHQGHVFPDGPPPTGLRYCNNGLSLLFVPNGEPLPALRT